MTGASAKPTGLGSASAPEPCGLGRSGAINACGGNSHFGGLFQNVRDAAVEALAEADAAHWTNRAKQVQP